MRIAYIIPGYGGLPKDPQGKKIAKLFEARGIRPVIVKINWKMKAKKPIRFYDFVDQFLKQYKKADQVYILGFSFGATIAFLAAEKIKPDALILCSLSPYFAEDLKTIKPAWSKWWYKHFKEEISFKDVAAGIGLPTHILAGDKEGPEVMVRAKDAKRQIKNSTLKIMKGVKHKIDQKEYLAELEKLISKL